MREIKTVRFRPGMTKREISWRMALTRLVTNRRKLGELQAEVKHLAALLTAKVEDLKRVRKERELRRVLMKLGLLR